MRSATHRAWSTTQGDDGSTLPGVLTDLYARAPYRLIRLSRRALGITTANAHEWLCPALGCRCAA